MDNYVIWFKGLGIDDIPQVGGKNASLGEMIAQLAEAGVTVPTGFATTADAYREFLAQSGLDAKIAERLRDLDVSDVPELQRAGAEIRRWIVDTPFTGALREAITDAFAEMTAEMGDDLSVAVRSSATAEDLPDASFAGQQETFLNVQGLDDVLKHVHEVFASWPPCRWI